MSMIYIVLGSLLGIIILIIVTTGYVKASPDEAIIVSGYKSKPRIITGTATVKFPFLERKDKLTLRAIKIDVKTERPVPTNEFIDVSVDSVVTAKISSDPVLIQLAAQNFLNKDENYIMDMVTISFNVQNFWDTNGIIEALGIENTSRIKRDASIVRADSERDVKIAQAKANKASNDEEVKSLREIAEKQHELNIKTAELKKEADTRSAEADSIRAKSLAEAEGIDKKAEAMTKMKEAAVLEMYFKVLPEIAKNVAKPLENINAITMYGEGNTSKMIEDITKATAQITTGLSDGLGIDIKSMLSGFLGGKASTITQGTPHKDVVVTEIKHSELFD